MTDPQRLRQILKNLLANAFKFTERGKVHVRVAWSKAVGAPTRRRWSRRRPCWPSRSATPGSASGRTSRRGFSRPFVQGDGTTARQFGGTGLGLSISRELAGLLGGEITLASTLGEGSTFTVYLPLSQPPKAAGPEAPRELVAAKPAEPAAPEYSHNGLETIPFEGAKVLVVDDDFRNVFALTALLERGHADVTVAESGAEALAALERAPDIDLVLMDIMMPGMDGYTTIRAIRAIDRFQSLPIIAVSGKVVLGERQRCIDAGANDYVPKPVDTGELVAAISRWLPAAAGA